MNLSSRNSFDSTLFKSRSCISNHYFDGVKVILVVSVIFFKSKLVVVSIMVLERRSN